MEWSNEDDIPHPRHEDDDLYLNDGHVFSAFRKFAKMREQRIFCDVTLEAEGVSIPAHRIVLSSCSDYFERMFTEHYKEGNQETVKLEGVDAETVATLINYMYTSKIHITEDNVEGLLVTSRMWFLNSVVDECGVFLGSRLNTNNCLTFWNTMIAISHIGMRIKAELYIDEHFEKIATSEEFLQLNMQQISNLISRDTLLVTSEDVVCESVMSWIKYNLKERNQHYGELMKYVRLPLVSKNYMKNRVTTADFECKDEIIAHFLHDIPPSRRVLSFQRVLLVVGGQPDQSQGSLEYYDLETTTWHSLLRTRVNLTTATVTTANQKIYVIGECNINNVPYRAFGEYDISRDSWRNWVATETKSMNTSSRNVALLNNCIYSIGDPYNLGSSNLAEKFDLKTQKRMFIARMSTARSFAALGALDSWLYAVGGYNFFCGTLDSAECYNPYTNTWMNLPNMKSPRQDAGICALDGRLYVVGGSDGKQKLNSVSVFDPKTRQWEDIASMTVNRLRPGVVACNNSLYVVGGDVVISTSTHSTYGSNTSNPRNTIEVYNPTKKTWYTLSQMQSARSGHGVALVYKSE